MRFPNAPSVADAVEEFEDVDGDFAPTTDLVAQRGGASEAVFGVQGGDAAGQVGNGGGSEIVVVRHRVGFTEAGDAFEKRAHTFFGSSGELGNVADSWRVAGLGIEQCLAGQPLLAVAGRHLDAMFRQVQPGVALGDAAIFQRRAEQAVEGRAGQGEQQ